jgi:predicted ester cyclase
MSDSPDVVARRWFEEVWEDGNENTITELMHPEAVAHGLGDGPMVGPDAFMPFYRAFHAALDDIAIDVVRTIVQGDLCAAHCHVRATHVGPELGAAPSGRALDFWGVTIMRVVDGRIVEGWNCFDFLTMYQQIGWVANPPIPQ